MTKTTGLRTFQIVQNIDVLLKGTLEDWPPEVQDKVYEALEAKSKEVELPLALVGSRCDMDLDAWNPAYKYFIHIVASEVVAADSRDLAPERLL